MEIQTPAQLAAANFVGPHMLTQVLLHGQTGTIKPMSSHQPVTGWYRHGRGSPSAILLTCSLDYC